MSVLSDLIKEGQKLESLMSNKKLGISEAKTKFYENFEKRVEDFYQYLFFNDEYFENPHYFCKSGPAVSFEVFQKSINLQGASEKGRQVEADFAFSSTGPLSAKLRFGFRPHKSGNFSFKISGSDDSFGFFIDHFRAPLKVLGSSTIIQEIPLKSEEIYELRLEIRRKDKNMNSQYKIYIEWKDSSFENFQAFLENDLCGVSTDFQLDCEKVCRFQFDKCFAQGFWSQESCVNSCSFYQWGSPTLLCLKPFFIKSLVCETFSEFSHVFGFCLLSRDLKFVGAYTDGWKIGNHEFDEIEESNPNLKDFFLSEEKPLVLTTRNKAFFLAIDPLYFSFESKILKLHSLKSHEKRNTKTFLYYPENRHRKSSVVSLRSPDFSEEELNSSISKQEEKILFMDDPAFNLEFIESQGGVLVTQKLHWCSPPRLSFFKADYFQMFSQVFKTLDFYFQKIPKFLLDYYHLKIDAYPIAPFKIEAKEIIDVLLGIETDAENPALEDLDYIEKLTNEGWALISSPFSEENVLVISNIPREKNATNNELVRQCFWDETDKKSFCKDYKPNYGIDSEKKFTFWRKRIAGGESFDLNNGFLMMVPFVKAVECRNEENFCTEGAEKVVQINNFLEENEGDGNGMVAFADIQTNVNDCLWTLDEKGRLFYRKGIDEKNRFGK